MPHDFNFDGEFSGPKLLQSQVLFYDDANIASLLFKVYYTGTIHVLFSNDGSIASDDGTYEEYTGTIVSGTAFTHTFSSTGKVLRMRIYLEPGATLYTPITNNNETDYMYSGTITRA